MDEDNVSGNRQTNLVEKIKMAFSNDKRIKRQSTSDSETSSLQPVLSRQSTHYNALNGILEESSTISDSSRVP